MRQIQTEHEDADLMQPASGMQKSERLETRISAAQKDLLQRAAALQGRSLSDFVVASAQRAAEQAIREHQIITLSERDSRAFVEAILADDEPNEHLRAAAARYQRDFLEQ